MNGWESNIQRIFEKWHVGPSTPGFAVGICVNSDEYFYSYGLKSLSSKTPITKSTKFHIASLSKMFTAYIFRCIEKQGLLKATERVSQYLPFEIFLNNSITFEHLISHTSGIRDQWDLTRFAGWRDHDPILQSDIEDLLRAQTELNFPPGKYYCYCNTGYTILALIMEKVTGLKMENLVTKYIKEKFKIQNIGYWSYKDSIADFAYAYKLREDGIYQLNMPQFDVTGSTSMFSTVEDLIRFEKRFASQNETSEALNSQFMLYEDGLIKGNVNGTYFELHSGWDYGYSSFLLRFPLEKCSIVFLSNSGKPDLFQYILQIAELIKPDFNIMPSQSLATIETVALRPGIYLNKESNTLYEISNKEGKLHINGNLLFLRSHNSMRLANSLNIINIQENSSFEVISMNSSMRYALINEAEVESLEKYIGRYYSSELNTYFEIIIAGNELYLKRPKLVKSKLVMKTSTHFQSNGFSICFDISDGILHRFFLSTFRSWNIRFERD